LVTPYILFILHKYFTLYKNYSSFLEQADIYIPNDGFLRGKKRGKVWHDESYKICCHRGFEVKRDGIVPVNKELCTNIRNNNGTLEPNAECVEGLFYFCVRCTCTLIQFHNNISSE
jgi:hypothetical protein